MQLLAKPFGGSLLKNTRKSARPFEGNRYIHLIFKAKRDVLLERRLEIQKIFKDNARVTGAEIRDGVVHANHIHLCVRAATRETFHKFLRMSAAEVSLLFGSGLWKERPFTRAIMSKRELEILDRYFEKNRGEVEFLINEALSCKSCDLI